MIKLLPATDSLWLALGGQTHADTYAYPLTDPGVGSSPLEYDRVRLLYTPLRELEMAR